MTQPGSYPEEFKRRAVALVCDQGMGIGQVAQAVEDCHFRMLRPDEISHAMAFAQGYTVLGTRREQVRQLGNAVTPPASEVLGSALVEAITGEEVAPDDVITTKVTK